MRRIVKPGEGTVFIDCTGKAPGGSACISNWPDCVKKLKKKLLINKVFSCEADEAVYTAIEEEYFGKK